eukprot:Hpha_TRINITY_DN15768_c1_g6::TRINITY_DN15768_c1_g6_i1::g.40565::m.40565
MPANNVNVVRALSDTPVDPAEYLKQFDADGDGDFDQQEMKKISEADQLRREEVERALRRALEREEHLRKEHESFHQQIMEEQAKAASECHPVLQALDNDGDGNVGWEELAGALQITEEQLAMARQTQTVDIPRLATKKELLEYPVHIDKRRTQMDWMEAVVNVRNQVEDIARRIRLEQIAQPTPGPLRGPMLNRTAAAMSRLLEHVANAEQLANAEGIDTSASPNDPIPGPTPIHAISKIVDVLDRYCQRSSGLQMRLEDLSKEHKAATEELQRLAGPQALGELEEPPPPRLPERDEAKKQGWDRLWDGKRRAECAHVLSASQQHYDEITDDLALGKRHLDGLTREQNLLRETHSVITELRASGKDTTQHLNAAWGQVNHAINAYREVPHESLSTSERDMSQIASTVQQAIKKDQVTRTKFKRAHGTDADWFQESRRVEGNLTAELQQLRNSHSAQVGILTRQLRQLHEEKKAEEQRLMAASLQYFKSVEDRQRDLVKKLEGMQENYHRDSQALINKVREAREQRRAKEQEDAAHLDDAIAAEQQRRIVHLMTLEKLNGLKNQVETVRPYFTAAMELSKRTDSAALVEHSELEKIASVHLPDLDERTQKVFEHLHTSLGRTYLHLAQLVYKNGLRQSELLAQQVLLEQLKEFCQDTGDPNLSKHITAIGEVQRRLEHVREADEEWQAAMRTTLKEQRLVGDRIVDLGFERPCDAKSELQKLFMDQSQAQQHKVTMTRAIEEKSSPSTALVTTNAKISSAAYNRCVSPVRVWQEETDRIAAEQQMIDDHLMQAELIAATQKRKDPEQERLEQLRYAASASAATNRTQHVARRLKKQKRPAARGPPSKTVRTTGVSAAVIRLDFPEVIDDNAIELPPEPSRLDYEDERVRRLINFDVDTPIAPPPPPAAPPPPPSGPPPSVKKSKAGRATAYAAESPGPVVSGRSRDDVMYDERAALRMEGELMQLTRRGQINAITLKREELISYLSSCLDSALRNGDRALAVNLQSQLRCYEN